MADRDDYIWYYSDAAVNGGAGDLQEFRRRNPAAVNKDNAPVNVAELTCLPRCR
jgi:hypothetical protein